MPSSFMVKRNYAHCPLKKRPLALYNEPVGLPEQEEPEDLSVKRPRIESPVAAAEASSAALPQIHFPVTYEPVVQAPASPPVRVIRPSPVHSHVYHQSVSTPRYTCLNPPSKEESREKLPNLAEYYIQLFRATSEAEAKKQEVMAAQWHSPPHYLPPSPQASPMTPEQLEATGSSPAGPQEPWQYPESSALISPVSISSSAASSESEEEESRPSRASHKRDARYSCEECGKSYSTYSGLTKHKQFHCLALGAKSFACKHCSKEYTTLGALKMHIRTHTLPCKCDVCGKAFSRPWLLQGHIRTHTGEKPFQCSQCERSFADRSNLRAHLQTHADVKKYACAHCRKTFSRMSLLNKHAEGACPVARSHKGPEAVPAGF